MKKLTSFFKSRKKALGAMMVAFVAMVAGATSVSASTTGGAIDFTGTSIGLSVTDVLSTAISFIDNVVPDFIMLGLGVIMAVVLIGFVFWVVSKIRRAAPGK